MVLSEMMQARGWTQVDLATILSKPQRSISEIVTGKKCLTPETAILLAAAFGNEPEFWMEIESKYRLSLVDSKPNEVSSRARLYDLAPVKEMAKRGWVSSAADPSQLEHELCKFFGQESLQEEPRIDASLRTSLEGTINPSQRAWCFRARRLAQSLVDVGRFDESNFQKGLRKLRRLAAWPEHAGKVPSVLASMGIRFVVVEPLIKTRIDGAAFWLDEHSPVIAMSIRYDRIDSFWHTLGHELSHIRHRDGTSLDIDLVGDNQLSPAEKSPVELRADREAAETWIDAEDLQSFIVRVGPLYSRERINQFANRMKIHPGIIVGQLQYRGEISYRNMRDTLVKVREYVLFEALTDGWGHLAPKL